MERYQIVFDNNDRYCFWDLPNNSYYISARSRDGYIKKASRFRKSIEIDGYLLDLKSLIKYLNAKCPSKSLKIKKWPFSRGFNFSEEKIKERFYAVIEGELLVRHEERRKKEWHIHNLARKEIRKVQHGLRWSGEINQYIPVTSLYLGYRNLKYIPEEIGALTNLRSFAAENNSLGFVPEAMTRLTNLQSLDLCNNRLEFVPNTWRFSDLRSLDLSHNFLSSLPSEILGMPHLKTLNLSYNRFASLPRSIGRLASLESLNVEGNEGLQELPMTLGRLGGLRTIHTNNTLIISELRRAILDSCRVVSRGERFSGRLNLWKEISRTSLNFDFIHNLKAREKRTINEWLSRLEKTDDFRGNQQKLASIACQMLHSIDDNKQFSKMFFDQVDVNNTACGDRAAMAFNEIFAGWKVFTLPKEADLKERLAILVAGAKAAALRTELAKLINQHEPNGNETVQIMLYYHVCLKDKLNHLCCIENMLYPRMGERDWINEENLIEAVGKSFIDHLIEMPLFDQIINDNRSLQESLEKNRERQHEKLEELSEKAEEGKIDDEIYKNLAKELMIEMNDLKKVSVMNWLKKQITI